MLKRFFLFALICTSISGYSQQKTMITYSGNMEVSIPHSSTQIFKEELLNLKNKSQENTLFFTTLEAFTQL